MITRNFDLAPLEKALSGFMPLLGLWYEQRDWGNEHTVIVKVKQFGEPICAGAQWYGISQNPPNDLGDFFKDWYADGGAFKDFMLKQEILARQLVAVARITRRLGRFPTIMVIEKAQLHMAAQFYIKNGVS